jgi:Zn-dependent peptidase ImmA (M78 family)
MSKKKSDEPYIAPRSRAEIEKIARDFRRKLGIDERHVPNMLDVLLDLTRTTGFRVKDVNRHPHSERVKAWIDSKKKILTICASVRNALKYGDASARETIAQELGHIELGHEGLLYDIASRGLHVNSREEIEAAIFSRSFLIPPHLSEKCTSSNQLMTLFRVTSQTAQIRFRDMQEDILSRKLLEERLEAAKITQVPISVGSKGNQPGILTEKTKLISQFELFRGNGGGIEQLFSDSIPDVAVNTILYADRRNIPFEVLNQLLILSFDTGMSRGFFQFYFFNDPHPSSSWYDPKKFPDFDRRYLKSSEITGLKHLRWGLYRLYIDGLLYFGNIRQAYRVLSAMSENQLANFFSQRLFAGPSFNRGNSLPLNEIPEADRYLIAETACKTYQPADPTIPGLISFLTELYRSAGAIRMTVKDLIKQIPDQSKYTADQLMFSLDEVLANVIDSESSIAATVEPIMIRFQRARENALFNTKLYLSLSQDLDIYVATSMRERKEFHAMAQFCNKVFNDRKVTDLKLRYFDPTLSAAEGHEDKGLIECLMVDCAKMLIYIAGERDSFGKAAEASTALNKGKPVIFFCDDQKRHSVYRDIHPLSRLINFENGVAVGSMVATSPEQVIELTSRIFRNDMEFELIKKKPNYFLLSEKLTQSTVRLQTDDPLLRETFWNYYKKVNH